MNLLMNESSELCLLSNFVNYGLSSLDIVLDNISNIGVGS